MRKAPLPLRLPSDTPLRFDTAPPPVRRGQPQGPRAGGAVVGGHGERGDARRPRTGSAGRGP